MTLKELREREGKSQREIACIIGITQPAIAKLERKGSSRLLVLERYANAIGVTFEIVRIAAENTRLKTNNYQKS